MLLEYNHNTFRNAQTFFVPKNIVDWNDMGEIQAQYGTRVSDGAKHASKIGHQRNLVTISTYVIRRSIYAKHINNFSNNDRQHHVYVYVVRIGV